MKPNLKKKIKIFLDLSVAGAFLRGTNQTETNGGRDKRESVESLR